MRSAVLVMTMEAVVYTVSVPLLEVTKLQDTNTQLLDVAAVGQMYFAQLDVSQK